MGERCLSMLHVRQLCDTHWKWNIYIFFKIRVLRTRPPIVMTIVKCICVVLDDHILAHANMVLRNGGIRVPLTTATSQLHSLVCARPPAFIHMGTAIRAPTQTRNDKADKLYYISAGGVAKRYRTSYPSRRSGIVKLAPQTATPVFFFVFVYFVCHFSVARLARARAVAPLCRCRSRWNGSHIGNVNNNIAAAAAAATLQ